MTKATDSPLTAKRERAHQQLTRAFGGEVVAGADAAALDEIARAAGALAKKQAKLAGKVAEARRALSAAAVREGKKQATKGGGAAKKADAAAAEDEDVADDDDEGSGPLSWMPFMGGKKSKSGGSLARTLAVSKLADLVEKQTDAEAPFRLVSSRFISFRATSSR